MMALIRWPTGANVQQTVKRVANTCMMQTPKHENTKRTKQKKAANKQTKNKNAAITENKSKNLQSIKQAH